MIYLCYNISKVKERNNALNRNVKNKGENYV